METSLKQRLVGAVVLVALGVIFIPALLDGSGYRERQARTVEIPPKPEFPPSSKISVKPIETPIDRKKQQLEKEKPRQAKPEQKPAIQSWALQVGTFSQQENADALRDSLRKAGYTAYVETTTVDGQPGHRVRIGPELDRDRLDRLKTKLAKEQKIDGYIVRHP